MSQFRVIAAKNDQRVELLISHSNEQSARESLHAQGYSIIEIKEVVQKEEQGGNFYYFVAKKGANETFGKIISDDIFKAYVKLVDGLGYDVSKIYTDNDTTEEEKLYVTAKTKETYAEFKKREIVKPLAESEKKQEKNQPEGDEKKLTLLEKEVLKYQGVISRVIDKLEYFVEFHSDTFGEQRTNTIKDLLFGLKQLRQSTNINKLKTIGEAVLIKIGKLELEISQSVIQKEKDKFLDQTNQLLKDLGSSKQVGGSIEEAKDKLKTLLSDVFSKNEDEVETRQKKTIDQSSFAYFKNLRDLSIYKDKLKETRKGRLLAFFKNKDLFRKLTLKERLIQQNIAIIEARVTKKRFSYSRIAKGLAYYNSVFIYLLDSLIWLILLGVSIGIIISSIGVIFSDLALKSPLLMISNSKIPFILASLFLFALIFSKTRSFVAFGFGFVLYNIVMLLLKINF